MLKGLLYVWCLLQHQGFVHLPSTRVGGCRPWRFPRFPMCYALLRHARSGALPRSCSLLRRCCSWWSRARPGPSWDRTDGRMRPTPQKLGGLFLRTWEFTRKKWGLRYLIFRQSQIDPESIIIRTAKMAEYGDKTRCNKPNTKGCSAPCGNLSCLAGKPSNFYSCTSMIFPWWGFSSHVWWPEDSDCLSSNPWNPSKWIVQIYMY
jgi:hypothetical protein